MELTQRFKYRAFISYSHSDEKWATWLHSALETYRVPRNLVGQETSFGAVPARISPVFRDREELPSATDLGRVLTQALRDSACQIVICSPAAARSRWVNEEVLTYKRLGRADRVFCLIVAGEPNAKESLEEAFPEAVRFKLDASGTLTGEPAEPIAADARPGKDGKQNARLKIIAGMLGVGLDVLKQREQHRRQRRLAALAAAAFAGMTITSTLATTAWFARIEAEAQRERAEAEAETARQTTNFLVDLFNVSDPNESRGNTITAREILDTGAGRIESELQDQPEIQTTLMDTMGTVYTSLGLYEPAASLLQEALRKREMLFGAEHSAVADTMNHLGEVLTLKADYADAERYLREALATRRRALGDTHELVAETLTKLADVLTLRGEYAAATPLITEALVIRQRLHGDVMHADIAESIEDLAFNYYDLGDYPHALETMRQALDMRRAVHPDIHSELATAINNLALLLYQTGDYAAAQALYEEGLAMLRQLLGPEHKDVAVALINVALVLHDKGDYEAAGKNYREALRIQEALLGPSHPDAIVTRNNLAWLLYDQGRTVDAVSLLRETLELARAGDPQHPDVAGIATNLASWLTRDGQYDEAGALLNEALVIRRRAFGEVHPLVADTLCTKADLLIAVQEYAEALETARFARAMLAESLGDDHWRIAHAESAAGGALVGLGEYVEAESLLVRSNKVLLDGGPATEFLSQQSRERVDHLYAVWKR
jgi:tetratricopeptide (TPR) repeat protein